MGKSHRRDRPQPRAVRAGRRRGAGAVVNKVEPEERTQLPDILRRGLGAPRHRAAGDAALPADPRQPHALRARRPDARGGAPPGRRAGPRHRARGHRRHAAAPRPGAHRAGQPAHRARRPRRRHPRRGGGDPVAPGARPRHGAHRAAEEGFPVRAPAGRPGRHVSWPASSSPAATGPARATWRRSGRRACSPYSSKRRPTTWPARSTACWSRRSPRAPGKIGEVRAPRRRAHRTWRPCSTGCRRPAAPAPQPARRAGGLAPGARRAGLRRRR